MNEPVPIQCSDFWMKVVEIPGDKLDKGTVLETLRSEYGLPASGCKDGWAAVATMVPFCSAVDTNRLAQANSLLRIRAAATSSLSFS